MKATALNPDLIPDGLRPNQTGPKRQPLEDRFWQRVDGWSIADCWLWTGDINGYGYGRLALGGRNDRSALAHRVAYMLFVGPIPDDLFVCHHCDNRRCVNPHHLYLGTPARNSRDMVERNRSSIGNRNGSAKLTESQVKEIRNLHQLGLSQGKIAKRFNVQQSLIFLIVHRKIWKHIG